MRHARPAMAQAHRARRGDQKSITESTIQQIGGKVKKNSQSEESEAQGDKKMEYRAMIVELLDRVEDERLLRRIWRMLAIAYSRQ